MAAAEAAATDDARGFMCGWLTKRGDIIKSWKRRYFVILPDGIVYYYTEKHDKTPKGQFNAVKSRISVVAESVYSRPYCFTCQVNNENQRVYVLQADSGQERKQFLAWFMKAGAIPDLSVPGQKLDEHGLPIKLPPVRRAVSAPAPERPSAAGETGESVSEVETEEKVTAASAPTAAAESARLSVKLGSFAVPPLSESGDEPEAEEDKQEKETEQEV